MKLRVCLFLALFCPGIVFAQMPRQIKHIVVIVQENRTPDNLFQGLGPKCPLPWNASGRDACTPERVTDDCYNISPCGISKEKTAGNPWGDPIAVKLQPVPLSGSYDPNHSHQGFVDMCDPDPVTLKCRNDGAYLTSCTPDKNGNCTIPTTSYGYVDNVPVTNYDGSKGHLLDPYLTLAKEYGWANFMYQTNQGPSYPAHQFLFSGTSTFTADDDAKAVYVGENFNGKTIGNAAGCLLAEGGSNQIISPSVPNSPGPGCVEYPGHVMECPQTNTIRSEDGQSVGTYCYPHASMADVLDAAKLSWKYYAPSPGSIWTAPDSIRKICQPQYVTVSGGTSQLECTGPEWKENVDADNRKGTNNRGTAILRDIDSCDLANVSWVIPDGAWSDHAGPKDEYGPSWVAAVINEIGNHPVCGSGTKDAGEKLWDDTAIIVTWDDWGGWSDHEPAPYRSEFPCNGHEPCFADYQYGFRVPMLVVSAYTAPGTINNVPHDFGSILRFIERVNGLDEGQLGFADARAHTALRRFFNLDHPREYHTIPAVKPASYFLNITGEPIDPDND